MPCLMSHQKSSRRNGIYHPTFGEVVVSALLATALFVAINLATGRF